MPNNTNATCVAANLKNNLSNVRQVSGILHSGDVSAMKSKLNNAMIHRPTCLRNCTCVGSQRALCG